MPGPLGDKFADNPSEFSSKEAVGSNLGDAFSAAPDPTKDLVKGKASLSYLGPQAGSVKDYAEYFPKGGFQMKDIKALDYARATNQSHLEQAGGFVNQLFAEVGGGIIEGAGYLLDIPGWFNSFAGSEDEWGNWLSDWGKDWKEWAREATPIYQENPGEWNPADPAWWFGNGVSLGSSLSLLIPAMGAVKAVSTVGKLARLGKGMSAMQKTMAKGVTGAVFSRHMENTMESSGVYEEVFSEHIAAGESEEDAKKHASQAAAHVYKYNWLMISQDIMQYALFNGAFKATKAAPYKVLRETGKSKVGAAAGSFFGGGYSLGKDMLLEGVEEGYQFVVSQEGKYLADKSAGLVDESNFTDRMKSYLKDGEMWTSFAFGSLGAGIMQTAGKPITQKINNAIYGKMNERIDENQARIDEIRQRGEIIKTTAAQLKTAKELNDKNAEKTILKNSTFSLAWKAANRGNTGLAKTQLDKIANASQEEREEMGVSEEFVAAIPQMKEDFDRIGELYEKNMARFRGDAKLSGLVSHKMFMVEHLSQEKNELDNEISEQEGKFPRVDELSAAGLEAFRLKSKIQGHKQANKTMDAFLKKGLFTDKRSKEAAKKEIKARGEEIKAAEEQLNKLTDGNKTENIELSKSDKDILKTVDGFLADDLFKAISRSELVTSQLSTYNAELALLNDKQLQKELKEAQKAAAKKAKRDAKESLNDQTKEDKAKEHSSKSNDEKSEPQDDGFDEIIQALEAGDLKIESLSPEMQERVNQYYINKKAGKENKDYEDDSNSERANNNEDNYEPDEVPDDELEDITKNFHANEETKLTNSFSLAWKSTNNIESTEEDGTEALTDFLEGPFDLNDIDLEFSIDFEFLESRQDGKYKAQIRNKFALMQQAIENGELSNLPVEVLLEIPVKANLINSKTGEPIVHNGEALTMHLHVATHDFNEATAKEQIEQLKILKTRILSGYSGLDQVTTYMGTGLKKANGHVYFSQEKFKIDDTFGDLSKLNITYGSIDGMFYDNNGEVIPNVFSQSESGGIYAIVENFSGDKVPLKLIPRKLTTEEAELIYNVFNDIITNDVFESRLSKETIELIQEHVNTNISDIENYLNLEEITYKELLDTLVLSGLDRTKGKGQNTLFRDKKGNVVFGNSQISREEFGTPKAKKAFTEYLINARLRQINVKRLGDVNYKKYLADHSVVTTNVESTPEGNVFVQPTVSFSGELRPKVDNTNKESVPTPKPAPIEEVLEQVEEDGLTGLTQNSGAAGSGLAQKSYSGQNLEVTLNEASDGKITVIVSKAVGSGKFELESTETFDDLETAEASVSDRIEEDLERRRRRLAKQKQAESKAIEEEDLPNVSLDFEDDATQVRETPDQVNKDIESEDNWDEDVEDGEDTVFRSVDPNTKSNLVNITDEAAHIRSILPKGIAIELQEQYSRILSGGNVAIGAFRDNVITLATQNLPGTAYHEAFHAIFRTALSAKERTQLYKEAAAIYPVDNQKIAELMRDHKIDQAKARDLFYEEQMADDFMEYMISKNLVEFRINSKSRLSKFFAKLSNWIKNVFNRKTRVEKLFNNIAKAKYKNKNISLDREIVFRRHKEFTPKQIKEITHGLAYAAMDGVTDITEIDKIDLEKAKRNIKILGKRYKDAGNEEMRDRAKKVYDHFDTFFAEETIAFIESMGIKGIISQEEEIENEDGNLIYPSSWEVSGKEKLSASVKFMLTMIPKLNSTESKITPDGRTRYLDYDRNNYLGIPTFSDYGAMYNVVKSTTSNTVSFIDENGAHHEALDLMLEKLIALSKYRPNMLALVSKLKESNYKVQTEFYNAMSSNKTSFITTLVSGRSKNFKYKFGDSDVSSRSKVLTSQWATNFADIVGTRQGVDLVYNTDVLNSIARDLTGLRKTINTRRKSKESNDVSKDMILLFLNNLGVIIQPVTLNRTLDQIDANEDIAITKFLSHLSKAVIPASGKKGLTNRRGKLDEKNNHILDEKTFFEALARKEAEMQDFTGEGMFLGPDGNQIYTYSDNNMLSKFIGKINSGETKLLKEIAQTPYGRNSLWTAALLKDPNLAQSFGLVSYGNFKEENAGDQGDKASNLKEIDVISDIVVKYLNGYFIGLAEADKSKQTYFKGPRTYSSDLIFNPTTGEFEFKSSKPRAMQYLLGYFKDEVARMNKVWTDLYDPEQKLDPKDLVANKHYSKKPGDHNSKTPNGLKSYLFPQMDLESMGVIVDGKPIDPRDVEKNKQVLDYIQDAFINSVKADMLSLVSKKVLGRSEKGAIFNKTLDTDTLNRYKDGKGRPRVENAIADFTLNSIIANVEQTKMFNGDPALYKAKKDLFEDFKKRVPAINASGSDMRIFNDNRTGISVRQFYKSSTISNIDNIPSEFFSKEENLELISKASGLSSSEVKSLFAPYLEVNRTDAQAWITLDAWRERMIGYGKWDNSLQDAYIRMSSGQVLPSDLSLIAQPLKTVHAELVLHKGEHIMHYNKQSEAVLLPGLTKGTDLDNLRTAMQNQKIDHVITLDGKKAGATGVSPVANEQGEMLSAEEIELNGVSLNYEYLFLQQDLPTKGIKNTLVASQGVKNIMGTIRLGAQYFNDTMSGLDFYQEYNTVITSLSNLEAAKLVKRVTTNDYTVDNDKVRKKIIEDNKDDLTDNELEALERGAIFDMLRGLNIESKLTSDATKKTVKMKQLGGGLIQLSDFGLLGKEVNLSDEVKDDIIWLKNPKEALKSMTLEEKEEGVIKTKAAQVLLPHTKLIKLLDEIGIDYKGLTHKEMQSLVSKDMLEGISYRIPNQGPSSNDPIEIVGFLPASMGDTIVSYSEITTKTGSDFDIDKAFIMLPNFKPVFKWTEIWKQFKEEFPQHADLMNKKSIEGIKRMSPDDRLESDQAALDAYNNNIKEFKANNLNKIVRVSYNSESPTKEGLQNRRLELMREALLHPEVYANVMAPLDNPWLSDLINGTNNSEGLYPSTQINSDLSFWSGLTQAETKKLFDDAKSLVGVIANHMTHHKLAQADKLFVENYYLGKGNSEEITRVISEDESETGSMTLFDSEIDEDGNLIEVTLGAFMNAIVDAAKDPYISRANVNQFTAGTTFMLTRAGLSREWIVGFMGQPILKRFVELTNSMEGRLSEVMRDNNGKKQQPINILLKEYGLNHIDQLQTLKNSEGNITLSREKLEEQLQDPDNGLQLRILGQFLEWRDVAKDLNDVIVASKADVNGAQKNLSAALLADGHLTKVLLGPIGNVDKLFGSTYEDGKFKFDDTRMMGTYHRNSARLVVDLYGDMFFNLTPSFMGASAEILTGAGYTDLGPNKGDTMMLDTANNSLFGALAGEFFGTMTVEEVNTLVLELVEAKDKYKDNLFISSLDIKRRQGIGYSIGLSNKTLDKDSKNNLFIDFENLIEMDRELGDKLVRYAYANSGFKRNLDSFYEHIPSSYLIEIGYAEFLENKLKELKDNPNYMDKYIGSVFKNNINNNRLVPVIQPTEYHVAPNGRKYEVLNKDGEKTGRPQIFTVNTTTGTSFIAGMNSEGDVEFKRFIKTRNNEIDTLYELMGYLPTEKGRKAIYVVSQKQGVHSRGSSIVEYNSDNSSVINSDPLNSELKEKLVSLQEDLEKGFEYPKSVIGSLREVTKYEEVSDKKLEEYKKRCGITGK